jgi:hypothetical protein
VPLAESAIPTDIEDYDSSQDSGNELLGFHHIMLLVCMLLFVLKVKWTLSALLVQHPQLLRRIQLRLLLLSFIRLIAMFNPHHPLQLLSRKRKGVGKRRRPGAFSFPFLLVHHLLINVHHW